MIALKYETLERLPVGQPVDRLTYIAEQCRDKVVLDVGCFDETAQQKRDTQHWLHGRLYAVAKRVVGVDSSDQIPSEGLVTNANAAILRGDGVEIDEAIRKHDDYDLVVAGEFIEHINDPLHFFANLREAFPGREFILSTPNGACFANTLLGAIGREVQHRDHLQVFSFKILNTLCRRAGFLEWEIIPYRFFATEMILQSRGLKRFAVQGVEKFIRVIERMFPLLSFGYIVHAKL